MIITVREDLTSTIISNDGLFQCELPKYNPETLVPFGNADEVEAFASTINGNSNYFFIPVTE